MTVWSITPATPAPAPSPCVGPCTGSSEIQSAAAALQSTLTEGLANIAEADLAVATALDGIRIDLQAAHGSTAVLPETAPAAVSTPTPAEFESANATFSAAPTNPPTPQGMMPSNPATAAAA